MNLTSSHFADAPFEERMLVCSTERAIGFSVEENGVKRVVRGPCGNVLKLRIYHTIHNVFYLGSEPKSIPVDYLVAVRDPDFIEDGTPISKRGACLTYGRRRRTWSTYLQGRVYTYGPTREMAVSFLHCKRCESRWHKNRFKAVNL